MNFYRNYVVEKRDKKSGDWVRCNDAINGTEVTISKLKEGHEYEFRVMAENANGLSEPLVAEKAILVKNPFSKLLVCIYSFINLIFYLIAEPGQPGTPECVSRNRDRIEVKWAPPRNDGRNPVKGYIVERREKSAKKKDWSKVNRGEVHKVTINKNRCLLICPFSFSREQILLMKMSQLIKNMNIVSPLLMKQVQVNQVIHLVVLPLDLRKVFLIDFS